MNAKQMSTLSTTLIVLVVAVLAGVGLYNLIQYRRTAPTSRTVARGHRDDDAAIASSIPGLGRIEPSLGTLDLPLHDDTDVQIDIDDLDSLPEEMAQISDLQKIVVQTPSRSGAATGEQTAGGARAIPESAAAAPSSMSGTRSATFTSTPAPPTPAPPTSAPPAASAPTPAPPAAASPLPASPLPASPLPTSPLPTSPLPTSPPASPPPASPPPAAASVASSGASPKALATAKTARPATPAGLVAGRIGESDSTSKPSSFIGLVAGSGRGGANARGASALPAPVLDPITDCIVEIRLKNPYGAERLLNLSQSLRRVGVKPVVFEGWHEASDQAEWLPIAPGQASTAFLLIRAGVLLANRHGPLNAMEFAEFTNSLGKLVDQLSAVAVMPDMTPVLEKARVLDDACIELDAQVGLNVDAKEPLSASDLERLAREQRLVERGSNRYVRLGNEGEVLFSVAHVEQPNRVTFLLDLPRSPAAQQPWEQLVECAKTAAVRLQGGLVDDEGRPLTDSALEQIGVQLAVRVESLKQAGFPAGSPLALRLFN